MDAEAQIIEQLKQQNNILNQILGHQRRHTALLTQITSSMQETDPNYRRPLSQYRQFDWEAIGATVKDHDQGGPTIIEWGGHQWLRRNAQSAKYGRAVWYSRHAGGSGDNVQYYTLIKFVQKMEVEGMTVDLPPQEPATRKPTTAVAKDWRADACSSIDPFAFDTAYLRYQFSYFKRTDVVMAAREAICGVWPETKDDWPAYATAVCDALDFYVAGVRKAKQDGGEIDKKALVAEAQQKFMEAVNDSNN